MKDYKTIEKELFKSVGAKFAELGFTWDASEKGFCRENAKSYWVILVSTVVKPDHFELTLTAGVGIKSVETLLYQLGMTEYEHRTTLGGNIGNLKEGRFFWGWNISGVEDIAPVVDAIMELVTSFVLPYLEEKEDLWNALELLRREDRRGSIVSPFDDSRAMRALAIAHLLRDKELFEQIKVEKLAYLRSKKRPGLPVIENFIRQLEELDGSK